MAFRSSAVVLLLGCIAILECWSAPIPYSLRTDSGGTCYDDMLENDVHPVWKPKSAANGSHVFGMNTDSERYPKTGYGFQWSNVVSDEGQHCFHFSLQGTYPAFIIEEVDVGLWRSAGRVPTTGDDMWNAKFSYYNSASNTGMVCPDQMEIPDCTDLSKMVLVFGGYGRDRGGSGDPDIHIFPDPASCPLLTPGGLNACKVDVVWNAGVKTPTPTPNPTPTTWKIT
uniref:Chitin-binding type-4 domain-containing protein n=1 Tax=Rhodosorus marinus TaxID=101924 RepID=A0A7S0BDC1_9RHOD|mmetsp:Transcript_10433/g.15119  ORF Transcript_10433/g.15119 Transcript_10433/m.15119 type:complete len:226 (+) Transcript_10433:261-938(+)